MFLDSGCNLIIIIAKEVMIIHSSLSAASPETRERKHTEGDTLETMPEAVPVSLTEPPIEEQLAFNTLWPESHKLYGHGNELFSLCCDHEGKLVASSCKVLFFPVSECYRKLIYLGI